MLVEITPRQAMTVSTALYVLENTAGLLVGPALTDLSDMEAQNLSDTIDELIKMFSTDEMVPDHSFDDELWFANLMLIFARKAQAAHAEFHRIMGQFISRNN